MPKAKGRPTQHPATMEKLRESAAKWRALKQQHADAESKMWAGAMLNLTPFDVTLLQSFGYLSIRDEQLLRASRQLPTEAERTQE